jgi:hypothetical protein
MAGTGVPCRAVRRYRIDAGADKAFVTPALAAPLERMRM